MTTGRNDVCPCGSGKKYKKCCLNKKDEKGTCYNLDQRNSILLSAMTDIFSLNKISEWKKVKNFITSDRIQHFHRVMAELWPPTTNLESLLPKHTDGKLRSLYLGRYHPELIIQNIVRYTLYTDEILVILPFVNPWCMKPEFNPIANPGQYKSYMIKTLAFVQQLLPWIISGQVKLIPDPGDFDYKLRTETWNMGKKRNEGHEILTKEDFEEEFEYAKEHLKYTLLKAPEEYIIKTIKEGNPEISDQELEKTLKGFKLIAENDPYTLNESLIESGGQLEVFRTGTNLEMGLYISSLTGAYLYTDWKPRWREILSLKKTTDESTWSPLTFAFQNLDFKFLNNVPNDFACSLRQDGRLENFRTFLRKIWKELNKENYEENGYSSIARDFADELKIEYHSAKAEWDTIDKNLIDKLSLHTVISSIAQPIITGGMSWEIPAGGFILSGILNLLLSRYDRRRFKIQNPMSVFIDLSKKR